MPSENNKRIAKNTIMLYIRTMVTMVLSFFTTRVVLNALGVVDYGLVNVIGSAVSMFAFFRISLSTAASRFFTYELGKGHEVQLRQTFSLVLLMYALLFLVLLILLETGGLWVFNHKLVIPTERQTAAFWFFHLTVATAVVGIWGVPYQSMIVSHEDMGIFAGLSMFEAVAKLGVVYLLFFASFDKLVFYGWLLLGITIFHTLALWGICLIKYPATHYLPYFNFNKFKQVLSFSSWNLLGTTAWMTSDSLVNVLLNNYFGVVVNAARAIALQIAFGAGAFTQSFLSAARPQIVKYWAANDLEQFHRLLHRTAKSGFFLLLLIALPVLMETEFVLALWLKNVPDYAVNFTRLIVLTSLTNSFSFPVVSAAQATGRIAMFESIGSGVRFLVFPLTWLAFAMGARAEWAFVIGLITTGLCVGLRVVILCRLVHAPLGKFVVAVFYPCVKVALLATILPLVLRGTLSFGWERFVGVGLACVMGTIAFTGWIGFSRSERSSLWQMIRAKCIPVQWAAGG